MRIGLIPVVALLAARGAQATVAGARPGASAAFARQIVGEMPAFGAQQWSGFLLDVARDELPYPTGMVHTVRDLQEPSGNDLNPERAAGMLPYFNAYLAAQGSADAAVRREAFEAEAARQDERIMALAREEVAAVRRLLLSESPPDAARMREALVRLETLALFRHNLDGYIEVDADMAARLSKGLPSGVAKLGREYAPTLLGGLAGMLRERLRAAAGERVTAQAAAFLEAEQGAHDDAMLAVGALTSALPKGHQAGEAVIALASKGLSREDGLRWPEFLAAVQAGAMADLLPGAAAAVKGGALEPAAAAGLLPAFRAFLEARRAGGSRETLDAGALRKAADAAVWDVKSFAWSQVVESARLSQVRLYANNRGDIDGDLGRQLARLRFLLDVLRPYLTGTADFDRAVVKALELKKGAGGGKSLPILEAVQAAYDAVLGRRVLEHQSWYPAGQAPTRAGIAPGLERDAREAVLLGIGNLLPYMIPFAEESARRPNDLLPASPVQAQRRPEPPAPGK